MTAEPIDLGSGHTLRFTAWMPDRELNPQYADLPDVDRIGAIITHSMPDGQPCESSILFDNEVTRQVYFGNTGMWTVESWEPLTLSPSLLCRRCKDHGFVRDGRWVAA